MFFKKKSPPKQDLHIGDQWRVLQGQHGGKPIIIRLNTWAKTIVGHPDFRYRVGIAIPFLSPKEDGFPNKDENLDFHKIEDEITETLQKNNDAVVSIIITTNGMREFMSYSSLSNIDAQIEYLKSKFPKYDFQHYITEDPKWDGYLQWYQ